MSGISSPTFDADIEEKYSTRVRKGNVTAKNITLDVNQIHEILPHRFPFLFVDRITKLNDKRAQGIKNVTISEPYFQGHIPGHPIMPGVLTIEAVAQVGAILVLTNTGNEGKLPYLLSIEKAKFRKPIYPGDQMEIEVEAVSLRKRYGKLRGEARVNGSVATEVEITFVFARQP